ncbi:MAG: HAMP domain-containing histidine kinase [Gemmatimonadetes bacterium]|nr:HAMP domain-containing histidine kinase [Gemmatimonadota bacterium]NNM05779.1 HAMP domain-containing histidine kinase [Gemmatimonadota bacterium]
MSLRRQYVLVFVAFSVLVTALGGTAAYLSTSDALERELDRRLEQVAGAAADVGLSGNLLLGFRPGMEASPDFQREKAKLEYLTRTVEEAYVVSQDLRALVTTLPTDSVRIGEFPPDLAPHISEINEAVVNGSAVSRLYGPFEGGRYYKYGFVRVDHSYVPGAPGSNAVLAVRMPAEYRRPLTDFRRTAIAGSLAAAVIAALVAWFMATAITGPLNRLGRVALRIQRGRMDEPVRKERGGELGRLSRAMERMRVGILHRDEQLRLMLAQVAHEIRNPLGGLELFASAAAEAENPEERVEFIGKVRDEITALNRIIDDFLTFARPLRPQGELHDVRVPVQEAVELVEIEMRDSGGKLTLELPAQPLLVKADSEHVKRVALNLVRNAAQAGQEVMVRCEAERGEVVLMVSDNGPGVPPELEDRVFEPFFTDKEQGAGLGLAIVKSVVEANGGRVELTTGGGASAVGAEFRVYLRGGEDLPPEEEED